MGTKLAIVLIGFGLCAAGAVAEIALEETDNNAASLVGGWSNSTSRILYYGDNYNAGRGAVDETRSATFRPNAAGPGGPVPLEGVYSVYARWTVDPNRCNRATYVITVDGGGPAAEVQVNQQANGGAWIKLGTYNFGGVGNDGAVKLSNKGCSGSFVIADGVRWVREDEVAVEYSGSSAQLFNLPATGVQTVKEITLTIPEDGHVVVHASGGYNNLSGSVTSSVLCKILMDNEPFVLGGPNQIFAVLNPSTQLPYAATRGFAVTAGSHTFSTQCQTASGTPRVFHPLMTAVYSPYRI